jgi:hypothetical protein
MTRKSGNRRVAKRDAMIARLREDFNDIILISCMTQVFRVRRERAGVNADFALENPRELLDEFLASSSVRQLKILREVAKGMRFEEAPPEDKQPDRPTEVITEVVKPPTAH